MAAPMDIKTKFCVDDVCFDTIEEASDYRLKQHIKEVLREAGIWETYKLDKIADVLIEHFDIFYQQTPEMYEDEDDAPDVYMDEIDHG